MLTRVDRNHTLQKYPIDSILSQCSRLLATNLLTLKTEVVPSAIGEATASGTLEPVAKTRH
jgi:hypothetical protein